MKKKNNDCEGQLSLADVFSPAEVFYMTTGRTDYWQQSSNIVFNDDGIPVLEEKIIDTSAIRDREILRGSGFSKGKTRIYNYFKAEHSEKEKIDFLKKEYGIGGWSTEEGFLNHDANGIDIKFNKPIGKTTAIHLGWMMVARRIDELIEKGLYKPKECKFSGHTCNKEELWKVAESLDDPFCPHVCCRKCATKQCGARCNGSEEPQKAAVDYETWHSIEEEPPEDAFCIFEYLWTRNTKEDSKGQCKGWWSNGKVKWLNMPWDIGSKRVISWKYAEEPKEAAEEPECSKANECEAYPHGCGGRIEPCRFGGPYKWSEQAQEVVIKGICDDGYCPKCNIWLDDLIERCPECNTLLDWTHWKRLNEEGEQDENSNRTL